MASGNKEHRMLFDIRGRRGNVIKVIYAVLALLMGLSLFILAGPIGNVFNSGGANNDAAVSRLEDQAASIEAKLAREPQNEDLLVALTRNHLSAANLLAEISPNGEPIPTVESRAELEKASGTWAEYLEANEEPPAGLAQQMSTALFSLAQLSSGLSEAEKNIAAAAAAQKLVADKRPSIGTRSTQALYTLYTFDYKEAEQVLAEAKQFATSTFQRQELQKQYDEVEKRSREFQKELKEAQKLEKQANGGKPQEALRNPLGLGPGPGLAE